MSADSAAAVLRRRRPPSWRRFLPLLGLCLLGWVLSRLDLGALSRAFGRVSLATLALSCTWFSLNLWLKAWRWQRLLLAQGIALPHRVALAAFLSAQFYAQVTVGRVGEFVRIEALTERGVSAGRALSSCIFDRLLDVCLVLFAGSVLGAFVLGAARAALAAALLMGLLALLAAAFVKLLGRERAGQAPGWLAALERRPWAARGLRALRELARGMLPMLRLATLLEASVWTAIAWCGYFAALFVLADGLHVGVTRVLLTATAAFAALTALLPVTISGLGARELIYIEVLRAHAVPSESAVALSLLHLSVMFGCAIVLGLLGVLWRQRQRP
jgi:glycosyltransferase 2 family protein